MVGIAYLLKKRNDIPFGLKAMIFDHLRNIKVDEEKEDVFEEFELGRISSALSNDPNILAKNISKYLPNIDVPFISECLSALMGFLNFFDSNSWKKIAESAQMGAEEMNGK
jgi:hypothetical protein